MCLKKFTDKNLTAQAVKGYRVDPKYTQRGYKKTAKGDKKFSS
jgi:hypothetical protein